MDDFTDGTALNYSDAPEMRPSRILAGDIITSLRAMSERTTPPSFEELVLMEAARRFVALYEQLEGMDPGYIEWDLLEVEKALAETGPGIPHEEVMRRVFELLNAISEQQ